MNALNALAFAGEILAFIVLDEDLFFLQKRQIPFVAGGESAALLWERFELAKSTLSAQTYSIQARLRSNSKSVVSEELALSDLAASLLESSGTTDRHQDVPSESKMLPEDAHHFTQLSQRVMGHVVSMLRSQLARLKSTIDSMGDARRFSRPEQESRIESITRELNDVKLELERRSVAANEIPFSKADVKFFESQLSALLAAEDALLAEKIAASLDYASRPARHDNVPESYKNTFQWAFNSHLAEWFSSGSGIFWISGKPGSGKSTFMKFIAGHSQTREILTQWAGSPDKLAIAVHFFWVAGTRMQKSWHGLLQSLLFDICRKHLSVVSLISPGRWEAAKSGCWQTATEPWTIYDLTTAFRKLASADEVPLKLCFFIDGLDEYDSDHEELCKVICDMANSPRVKICVSSRPWIVFEKGFGGKTQGRLDIHEVTRSDIRHFVTGQLVNHHEWTKNESPPISPEMSNLIKKVVSQADGVFLWAFLVTQAIGEGFNHGSSIEAQRKRLSELPTDLDMLFKHMLEDVGLADQSKMAGVLQGAAHAFEPLHIDLYWQLEREIEEHGYAFSCQIAAQSSVRNAEQRLIASRSIDKKTKGLLKVTTMQRVEFLHRTVKDFVLTNDMENYMRGKLPEGYNSFIAIAAAYLGLLKCTSQIHPMVAGIVKHGNGLNNGPFISQLNQAMLYVSEALKVDKQGTQTHERATALINQYDEAVEMMLRIGHTNMKGIGSDCSPKLPFREELLRHDLASYIEERTRHEPEYFNIFNESPLFSALTPMALNSGQSPAPAAAVLSIILRQGANPNAVSKLQSSNSTDAMSPWVLFARGTMSVFNMLSGPLMFPALRWNDSLHNAVFDLLLSHGADPNASLLNRPGAHTVFSHFLAIATSPFLGEECFDDYLRTLDAFLRVGASLDVPPNKYLTSNVDAAFGNLARVHPEEPVLSSYCNELKGIATRLAADKNRAKFLSSVTQRMIPFCPHPITNLPKLASAVSAHFPQLNSEPLVCLIQEQLDMGKLAVTTRKRQRESFSEGPNGSSVKQHREK